MVVEDDASLREIYGIRIAAEGYDVVSAGDGEEALAMAVREKPDLILADVMMPKISGFDMLDILRSTPETANIKVVMMTALSGDDQRERGERLGADRYLVKSQVGIEDMVNTIHEVLGDRPAAAEQPVEPVAPAPTPEPSAPESAAESMPTPEPIPEPAPAPESPTAPASSEQYTPIASEPSPEPGPVPMPTPEPTFAPAEPTNPIPPVPEPTQPPVPPVAPQPSADFSAFTTNPQVPYGQPEQPAAPDQYQAQ